MFKIVSEEPRPLAEVSAHYPGVAAAICRGLAKDPNRRHASCSEFVAEMRTAGHRGRRGALSRAGRCGAAATP